MVRPVAVEGAPRARPRSARLLDLAPQVAGDVVHHVAEVQILPEDIDRLRRGEAAPSRSPLWRWREQREVAVAGGVGAGAADICETPGHLRDLVLHQLKRSLCRLRERP